LPKFLREWIINIALDIFNKLLDLNFWISREFTPDRFVDEMKGLADGSGVDYVTIRRLNYYPELT